MLENRIDITQRSWDADRPAMAAHNQDLFSLAILYEAEHNELLDAWLTYMVDPSEYNREQVLDESADTILFATQLIHTLGSTVEETVMTKRAYNTTRYTANNFGKDAIYDEARDKSRQWVKERNWKDQIYPKQEVVVYQAAAAD